jgi:Type IV secretion-system coupling protein DNA-binding domain
MPLASTRQRADHTECVPHMERIAGCFVGRAPLKRYLYRLIYPRTRRLPSTLFQQSTRRSYPEPFRRLLPQMGPLRRDSKHLQLRPARPLPHPDRIGDERIWHQYAQIFLTAVMRQSYRSGLRENAGLYRLITSAPTDELQNLLEHTPAQPFVAAGNERMFGSLRSITTSAMAHPRH